MRRFFDLYHPSGIGHQLGGQLRLRQFEDAFPRVSTLLFAVEPLRPQFDFRTPLAVYFRLLALLLTQGGNGAWLLEQLANAAKEGRIVLSGPQYCEPVRALLDGMSKKESARIAGAMLATAEQAVAKGYPTLAGVYLSVFGWALPEAEKARAESLVKRITDAGGVWFRPFLGVAASWQRIVSALDEKLPKLSAKKSADTGKVKSGRIIWGLSLGEFRRDVQPFFRGPRGAEDGSDDKKITLMSLKAGGTGINLTAANYVVLLDPWWDPAVEDQAADRAHRIGQRNPVTVYRLIAAGTVEERVLELHQEKKELARDVLDGTGAAALTPEALMGLFA